MGQHLHHSHNFYLVALSILIAIFASYTALDLANSVSNSRGRIRYVWLIGGSLAMGIGIWSMHFIGMLAFKIPGLDIYYDVPLLILSIIVAILASALALNLVATREPTTLAYFTGSLLMGSAIAGMHYIGIASMKVAAIIHWNTLFVLLSLLIAFAASFGALLFSFKLRNDLSAKGFIARGLGGLLMGIAISGMHYTAMSAMRFTFDNKIVLDEQQLLATDGLATAIIIGTLVVLGIALTGSNVERALYRKTLLNDTLEDAIRARDEFLSIASHELKTPLTSIKLHIEFIIRQIDKNEFDKDKALIQLKKTNKSLNRITNLVDDMLDIARIRTGKLNLNKVPSELDVLIAEVIERFRPQFEVAGVHELTFKPAKAMGNFDVFRVEQVITNLLSNSLKYGNKKPVEVSMNVNSNQVIIAFKDYGLGISEDNQKKIFNRFERGSSPHQIAGLGLGLSIVEDIVKAHLGKIWVESEVGKGSTFYVSFPLT